MEKQKRLEKGAPFKSRKKGDERAGMLDDQRGLDRLLNRNAVPAARPVRPAPIVARATSRPLLTEGAIVPPSAGHND